MGLFAVTSARHHQVLDWLALAVLVCGVCLLLGVDLPAAQDAKALQHAREMQELAETYKSEVKRIFESVLKNSSEADRKKLRGVDRAFSTDETPFAFYAAARPKKNTIYLTTGGLTSLDLSAIAATIDEQLLNHDGWWFDYLVAERALVREAKGTRQTGLKLWAGPEDVLGCDWKPNSQLLQEKQIGDQYVLRMNMLAFMIAHEAAHLVLGHDAAKKDGETADELGARLREYELAADNWALPVLVRMRVNPYDIVRLLFTHLVIFGTEDSDGQVHRGDVERIRHVSEVYQREFSSIDYGPFNILVATLLNLLTDGGNAPMFDYLDAKADRASFGDLHYLRRKNRAQNFTEVCQTPEVIPAWIRELSRKIFHPSR